MNDFITYPNNIDSAELSRIKNNFKLRDRSNSENRDDVLRRKRNPVLYFDSFKVFFICKLWFYFVSYKWC